MKTNNTTTNPYKVGDIVYADLGWNRSLPAFYQVLKTTDKTVVLRQLAKRVVSSDYWGQNGTAMPVIPEIKGGEEGFRRKVTTYGSISIDKWSFARPWDGQPKSFTTD